MIVNVNKDEYGALWLEMVLSDEVIDRLKSGEKIRIGCKSPSENIEMRGVITYRQSQDEIDEEAHGWDSSEEARAKRKEEVARSKAFADKLRRNSEEKEKEMRERIENFLDECKKDKNSKVFLGKLENSEEMIIRILKFLEECKKDKNLEDLFSETFVNMLAEGLTHKLCRFFKIDK